MLRKTVFVGVGLLVVSLACSESTSTSSSDAGSGDRPGAGTTGEAGSGESGANGGASAGRGGAGGRAAGAGPGGRGGAGAASGATGGNAGDGAAFGAAGADAGAGAASGDAGAGAASGAAGSDGGAGASGGSANGGAGADSGGTAGTATMDCRTTGCMEGRECLSRPGSCDAGFSCWDPQGLDCTERPVCGCDGVLYASRCAALEAGTWVGPASACETPPGRDACFSEFCDAESEYCEITDFITNPLGVCPLPEPYRTGRCLPIPEDCRESPNCGCDLPCRYPGGNCDDDPLTRFCQDGCVG